MDDEPDFYKLALGITRSIPSEKTVRLCKQLIGNPLLILLDSGNDFIDNVAVRIQEGYYIIIKRNLLREGKENWIIIAKECSLIITSLRDWKTVYIGRDWKTVTSKEFQKELTMRAGYEIIEHTIDKHGQFLLISDGEVSTC